MNKIPRKTPRKRQHRQKNGKNNHLKSCSRCLTLHNELIWNKGWAICRCGALLHIKRRRDTIIKVTTHVGQDAEDLKEELSAKKIRPAFILATST